MFGRLYHGTKTRPCKHERMKHYTTNVTLFFQSPRKVQYVWRHAGRPSKSLLRRIVKKICTTFPSRVFNQKIHATTLLKGSVYPPPFAHGTLGGPTAHLEVVFFPTPSPRTPGGLLGPPHTWAFLGTFAFSTVVTRRSAPEWQKDIISGPMGSRGSKIGIWALLA